MNLKRAKVKRKVFCHTDGTVKNPPKPHEWRIKRKRNRGRGASTVEVVYCHKCGFTKGRRT